VLRYGPKFYLQQDYESEDDENEDEGGEADDDDEVKFLKSLKTGAGLKQTERTRQSVAVVEPSFPEFLTSQDDRSLRESTLHSEDVPFSRTSVPTFTSASERRRRQSHRQSLRYSRPTFHS